MVFAVSVLIFGSFLSFHIFTIFHFLHIAAHATGIHMAAQGGVLQTTYPWKSCSRVYDIDQCCVLTS